MPIILQQEGILQKERYAASGTITRDTKVIETSGALGAFDTDEDAEATGLAWACAWVDNPGWRYGATRQVKLSSGPNKLSDTATVGSVAGSALQCVTLSVRSAL